jgi:pyruvate-formate lyase-activating enzyme
VKCYAQQRRNQLAADHRAAEVLGSGGLNALSVAFVLPYGEHAEGFFPDTLLGQLCALAREAGHRADLVRVYYDGRDAQKDLEVRRRLERWLADRRADVVVVDRLFDPAPLVAHARNSPNRRNVMICRGDSFEPVEGVDLVVGATRRGPSLDELGGAFEGLLRALADGIDPLEVPGVSRLEGTELLHGRPLQPAARRPFRPVVEHDFIGLREPPRVVRKYLFGNTGCPFAADPMKNPHYAGVKLPAELPIARLGCAFCCMGGDYQKRPDAEVVASLVEQALFLTRHTPGLEELVLGDQHALRYLGRLVRSAAGAGVPPVRWLFAARPDSFIREMSQVDDALRAAEGTGHSLELYLSGFEAFSDRELLRYNKGVDVATQLEAVAAMRALARAHPGRFRYDQVKGHSLILWNPWTTPEDLGESARQIRANGLLELFNELGRNRLRLYRDLPIFHAAQRDGALTDAWEQGDEGAGRRKGYNVEHPWRFLDPRTRQAHTLARALRERLGPQTEPAQLIAVAENSARDPAPVCEVERGVDGLSADLLRLASERRSAEGPPRGNSLRAAPVYFAGACNNGCAACANRDTWLDDAAEAVLARVDEVHRGAAAVMLAGREPTLHPAFLAAVARAAGRERRPVGVVSNGRRFAYRHFARAAVEAGLRSVSLKLFAPGAAVADAISRDEGGYEQALRGLKHLREVGIEAVELRAPIHRDNLEALPEFAGLARRLGVDHLRVEAAIDAVGLDRLEAARAALSGLVDACRAHSVALEVSPLEAGTRDFDWLPRPREARTPAAQP